MRSVLFASTLAYLPQASGGSQSSTHDLCLALRERQVSCSVLAELRRKNILYYRNRLRALVGRSRFPKDSVVGYPVYRGWTGEDDLVPVLSDANPDVVVIQAGAPARLARRILQAGVRTAIYLRDVEFDSHGGAYFEHPKLNYIANSNFTARRFWQRFKLKATVIPPLVRAESYRVEATGTKIVFICPAPEKGVELAFGLAERNPDLPFLFVESWPMSQQVQREYQARAKRAGNIEWLGRQKDMRTVYRQAKLMLVPSIWEEAWGRVATEAQFSGIPVLASNRGGLPESVGSGGITLDPESRLDAWDESLNTLYQDKERYRELSTNARQYSQRPEISPERIIDDFLSAIGCP